MKAAKRVIVHLGPHKTGSTAIQKCLGRNSAILATHDIHFLHNEETHQAALLLAREEFLGAEKLLEDVSRTISKRPENNIIISQEDFSGDMAGRSKRRQIYPKLTKNLRILMRALRPHHVSFIFFVRDEESWLRSCYIQNLKHRTKFYNFTSFREFFGPSFSWANKLEKPIGTFGDAFEAVAYSCERSVGVETILARVGSLKASSLPNPPHASENVSPNGALVAKLEHINRVTEFQSTAWFAKSLIMSGWSPNIPEAKASNTPSWPPTRQDPSHCALPSLLSRTSKRVPTQSVGDILPAYDVDLNNLANEFLPKDVDLPSLSRERMENQSRILDYHLRGKTRLAHLNALTISYLRRSTDRTQKASFLFHRIWQEHGSILINELSTRWLISTLQTFLDHGRSEAQRQIGTVGYFYANLIKIYEGERSIEGRDQDADYLNKSPQTKNLFRGLDRFEVGGTDLMLNTNALALEVALKDDVAGLVLQELLLRVKSSHTAFSRLDKARLNLKAETPGFQDTWTFFEAPDG